jgi:hypothetical protein
VDLTVAVDELKAREEEEIRRKREEFDRRSKRIVKADLKSWEGDAWRG